MEYSIQELARLSGVSTRTLRYYDEIGLLHPCGRTAGGYRLYGSAEVERLQHILFYRELAVPLEEIKQLITSPTFDKRRTLENHLAALQTQKARLEKLIGTVGKTLASLKGDYKMNDKEKFEGFKQELVRQNETAYGKETRAFYGDEAVDAANARLLCMTPAQYAETQALSEEIALCLKEAVQSNNPACAAAQKACALHREWLCRFWKEGAYTKKAHCALGQMYVADARFKAYYDAIAPGAAAMLAKALEIYCA